MTPFKLTGLLRLRQLREEEARHDLGASQTLASAAHATTTARADHAHHQVDPESGTALAFLAAQAARSAAFSSLADAQEEERQSQVDLDAARDRWQAARSRSRAVERLRDQHEEREQRAEARRDQNEADDRSGAARAAGRRADAPTSPDGDLS